MNHPPLRTMGSCARMVCRMQPAQRGACLQEGFSSHSERLDSIGGSDEVSGHSGRVGQVARALVRQHGEECDRHLAGHTDELRCGCERDEAHAGECRQGARAARGQVKRQVEHGAAGPHKRQRDLSYGGARSAQDLVRLLDPLAEVVAHQQRHQAVCVQELAIKSLALQKIRLLTCAACTGTQLDWHECRAFHTLSCMATLLTLMSWKPDDAIRRVNCTPSRLLACSAASSTLSSASSWPAYTHLNPFHMHAP